MYSSGDDFGVGGLRLHEHPRGIVELVVQCHALLVELLGELVRQLRRTLGAAVFQERRRSLLRDPRLASCLGLSVVTHFESRSAARSPVLSKNGSRSYSIRFRDRPRNTRLQTRTRTFLCGRYHDTGDSEWKVVSPSFLCLADLTGSVIRVDSLAIAGRAVFSRETNPCGPCGAFHWEHLLREESPDKKRTLQKARRRKRFVNWSTLYVGLLWKGIHLRAGLGARSLG